ncbi:MAG TPA: carboxypeptidase regulatory-like domain-containing protein [Myxococcota bacterium]|jgi:plastocyanin|nr:carboxypeptidase regulatory-like domain-containing protein [Myxococcota bacterium]
MTQQRRNRRLGWIVAGGTAALLAAVVATLSVAARLATAAAGTAGAAASTGTAAGSVLAKDSGRPVIVYLEHVPVVTAAAAAATGAKHAEIVQKGRAFVPGVAVVVAGSAIDFPNLDKFYHNVFSVTPGDEFDLGLYRGGVTKSVTLRKPGEVDVYCNIHPDMVAKVLVLENPFYAEAGGDGAWTIAGVPPGSYTVVAWSPTHVPDRRTVEVKAGAVTRLDLALKDKRPDDAHMRKDGTPYGRYK